MAKGSGSTKSVGASGASATRTTTSSTPKSLTPAERLADVKIKLTMSDLNFTKSADEEANEELEARGSSTRLSRWVIPDIPYVENGQTKTTWAVISQFLESPMGGIGGYELHFNGANAIGEAKTLEQAKAMMLKHINKFRG